LKDYSTGRLTGERFGDFVLRTGVVKQTHTPHDFHEQKNVPATAAAAEI
jgi:hypothetical protein